MNIEYKDQQFASPNIKKLEHLKEDHSTNEDYQNISILIDQIIQIMILPDIATVEAQNNNIEDHPNEISSTEDDIINSIIELKYDDDLILGDDFSNLDYIEEEDMVGSSQDIFENDQTQNYYVQFNKQHASDIYQQLKTGSIMPASNRSEAYNVLKEISSYISLESPVDPCIFQNQQFYDVLLTCINPNENLLTQVSLEIIGKLITIYGLDYFHIFIFDDEYRFMTQYINLLRFSSITEVMISAARTIALISSQSTGAIFEMTTYLNYIFVALNSQKNVLLKQYCLIFLLKVMEFYPNEITPHLGFLVSLISEDELSNTVYILEIIKLGIEANIPDYFEVVNFLNFMNSKSNDIIKSSIGIANALIHNNIGQFLDYMPLTDLLNHTSSSIRSLVSKCLSHVISHFGPAFSFDQSLICQLSNLILKGSFGCNYEEIKLLNTIIEHSESSYVKQWPLSDIIYSLVQLLSFEDENLLFLVIRILRALHQMAVTENMIDILDLYKCEEMSQAIDSISNESEDLLSILTDFKEM